MWRPVGALVYPRAAFLTALPFPPLFLLSSFSAEQRVKKEMGAPHEWNETWAGFFKPEIPTDYTERIKFLERELETTKASIERPPKYGVGPAFKEIQQKDYKRQRMFRNEFDD